ncbi:NUDIX hydrolase [Ferrimonas gelatinilytica]|uniref:NUDIX hydrolase n=1 Tax=Ferrimonas gelatinilytica TaxID=1255257 RepID=UPI0031E5002A
MNGRFLPHTTVACVVRSEERYLLVEECIDGEPKLNQPAGHLEAQESLLAACQRELFEETGLALAPQRLLRIYQFVAADGTPFVRFTFALTLPSIPPTAPQDPDILRCHWLTKAQVLSRRHQLRSPLVLQSIEDFERGAGVPVDRALDLTLYHG